MTRVSLGSRPIERLEISNIPMRALDLPCIRYGGEHKKMAEQLTGWLSAALKFVREASIVRKPSVYIDHELGT